jgi:hypothetical protein
MGDRRRRHARTRPCPRPPRAEVPAAPLSEPHHEHSHDEEGRHRRSTLGVRPASGEHAMSVLAGRAGAVAALRTAHRVEPPDPLAVRSSSAADRGLPLGCPAADRAAQDDVAEEEVEIARTTWEEPCSDESRTVPGSGSLTQQVRSPRRSAGCPAAAGPCAAGPAARTWALGRRDQRLDDLASALAVDLRQLERPDPRPVGSAGQPALDARTPSLLEPEPLPRSARCPARWNPRAEPRSEDDSEVCHEQEEPLATDDVAAVERPAPGGSHGEHGARACAVPAHPDRAGPPPAPAASRP